MKEHYQGWTNHDHGEYYWWFAQNKDLGLITLERSLFYFIFWKNTTCKKYVLLAKCEILPIQSISQWHFVHECFKNTLPSILCQSGLYCTLYIAHTCLVCGHYRKIQSWLIFRQSHCTSHITVTILPCKACLPQRWYFNSKKGRKEMGYLWPNPCQSAIFTKYKPHVCQFVDKRYLTGYKLGW